MSTILIHRNLDPFPFYNLYISIGEVSVTLDQDETHEITLPAGNYSIHAGFRFLYKGRPLSVSLAENEILEIEVAANVDYSKPFESLNWSLRFRNLFIISRKEDMIEKPEPGSATQTPPASYISLLAIVSLLPAGYLVSKPATGADVAFVLLIPILTCLTFLSFIKVGKRSIFMPTASELFAAFFYVAVGLLSKFILLYFIAVILFIILYRFKQPLIHAMRGD
jgi:hypothetical protein